MSRTIPAALEKRYETANARLTEVTGRPYNGDNAVWAANQRDLLAAWDEMLAVYTKATKVTGLGVGLLWSALYDAKAYARRRRSEIEHELKTLGGES
jgi:hypothetical protein